MDTKQSAVDLTDLALAIIVLGIVVSIGATILLGVRDASLTDLPLVTNSNETILATDAGTDLSATWVNTITGITNSTGGETILSGGNYSLAVNSGTGVGTVTFVGTSPYNGTNVNATYTTYDTTSPNWALANDAANGLGEYGNWFDIIVIVGIAAVILALIFMAFGRNTGSLGGVNY